MITQLEKAHHDILKTASGTKFFNTLSMRTINNNDASFDALCNVSQLHASLRDCYTNKFYTDASNVRYNDSDVSSNIGLTLVKQFLNYITNPNTTTGEQSAVLKRLDNLFTPNETKMDWSGSYYSEYRAAALAALGDVPNADASVNEWLTDNSVNNVFWNDVSNNHVYEELYPGHALYDYRRRRNKYDFMEVLQRGDKLCFTVTLKPLKETPLGNNPIAERTYKYELTLQDAEGVDYTSMNNLGKLWSFNDKAAADAANYIYSTTDQQ